jgi:Zn-dependent protease with chaperone function
MVRGLVLLLLTFLIELPSTIFRWFLFTFIVAVSFMGSAPNGYISFFVLLLAWAVALLPMLAALLACVWPADVFTRFVFGARQPSQREQAAITDAVGQFTASVPLPQQWFVVDAPTPNAYVVGRNVYIERELFQTPYLAPILAHELGHVNSADGRLILALRRLAVPAQLAFGSATQVMGSVNRRTGQVGCIGCLWSAPMFLFLLFGGGWGLRLTRPLWLWLWRDREFAADAYAANLGQGPQLAQALDDLALFVDTAAPFMAGRAHPYTEQRIDRLLQAEQQQGLQPL